MANTVCLSTPGSVIKVAEIIASKTKTSFTKLSLYTVRSFSSPPEGSTAITSTHSRTLTETTSTPATSGPTYQDLIFQILSFLCFLFNVFPPSFVTTIIYHQDSSSRRSSSNKRHLISCSSSNRRVSSIFSQSCDRTASVNEVSKTLTDRSFYDGTNESILLPAEPDISFLFRNYLISPFLNLFSLILFFLSSPFGESPSLSNKDNSNDKFTLSTDLSFQSQSLFSGQSTAQHLSPPSSPIIIRNYPPISALCRPVAVTRCPLRRPLRRGRVKSLPAATPLSLTPPTSRRRRDSLPPRRLIPPLKIKAKLRLAEWTRVMETPISAADITNTLPYPGFNGKAQFLTSFSAAKRK